MKTYNKVFDQLVALMDDDIREQVHRELAPCSNEEFLSRYLELDPAFDEVLSQVSADEDWYW